MLTVTIMASDKNSHLHGRAFIVWAAAIEVSFLCMCCLIRNLIMKLKLSWVYLMQDAFQSYEAILLHLMSVSQSVIQSLNHILSTLITALLSSSLTPATRSSLSVPRSAPPLLSSVVATYETVVTVHPHCLLEFRYPECCSCAICMAGFGPLTGERECGFELFI